MFHSKAHSETLNIPGGWMSASLGQWLVQLANGGMKEPFRPCIYKHYTAQSQTSNQCQLRFSKGLSSSSIAVRVTAKIGGGSPKPPLQITKSNHSSVARKKWPSNTGNHTYYLFSEQQQVCQLVILLRRAQRGHLQTVAQAHQALGQGFPPVTSFSRSLLGFQGFSVGSWCRPWNTHVRSWFDWNCHGIQQPSKTAMSRNNQTDLKLCKWNALLALLFRLVVWTRLKNITVVSVGSVSRMNHLK